MLERSAYHTDVLIVGGGPAGLAAAVCAAEAGAARSVAIIDDNHALGGQIWRGEVGQGNRSEKKPSAAWFDRVRRAQVKSIYGARIFAQPESKVLLAEMDEGVAELHYDKLILATGARERFLPFHNWTLPNVMGAGGLQALVKAGLPIEGKRVIVAGSGPLLLAVAAYLKERGADVRLIAEQARFSRVFKFGFSLWREPGKLKQAIELKSILREIPYRTGCWAVAAKGKDKLESVTMRRGARRVWDEACDYLACGFHLVPNTELAQLIGCATRDGRVVVDEFQSATVPHVYCAGEATGIGGLELSLIEGRIAGYAAAGKIDAARGLFAQRRGLLKSARRINETFALRDELRGVPQADTIVCRCEDVTYARLKEHASWREAKLQTRCGMGPCQGRICGPATAFLLGWNAASVRPPIFPVRVECLAHVSAVEELEANQP